MKSIQQNIKRNTKDFSEFGLWVGGLDVSTKNIDQFDPLRAGYSRIFIVRLHDSWNVWILRPLNGSNI